jgi:uncharacterized Zn-finger protein
MYHDTGDCNLFLHTGDTHPSATFPNFLEPSVKRERRSVDSALEAGTGPRALAALGLSTVRPRFPFLNTPSQSNLVPNYLDERQCGVCSQLFSSVDACKRHKMKHEASGFKHCCMLCLKKFYRKDALQSHLRKRHKMPI